MSKKLKIIFLAGAIVFIVALILFMQKRGTGIAKKNNSEFIQIDALSKVIQEKDKEKKKEEKKEEAPKKEIKEVFKPVAFDKETCDKLKGEWVQRPLDEKYICNIPTSDSGKDCIDEAECQGSCLAEFEKDESGIIKSVKGKCSEWTIVLGCLNRMKNGQPVSECRD